MDMFDAFDFLDDNNLADTVGGMEFEDIAWSIQEEPINETNVEPILDLIQEYTSYPIDRDEIRVKLLELK